LVVICLSERRSFTGDGAQRFWIIAASSRLAAGPR
jgi:hypothetical protein